ncbi:ERCC4 domain containing protein [Tritrichomonas foetus]|uniref:ERCC4 domain containing protein n=1 Tax=Tritrichomonas foetus TaxID=1144522 RepID=A0A1J4JP46_9EUKA|nr:ERCC4 domain containing protein [Tritrichomonas foetus]|eukprot:OHT00897.1 ERCC4 domain containing protein [Tritrichomonas foetus]
MLKYHKYIWDSFRKKPSGLYILGKGLDVFEIEKQLIIEYSKNHKLVFVFGISENDKQRIIWEAANSGIEFLPKDIEKDTGRKERIQHYESNLVFFHNPGILAKDFLQGIIDPLKIDGFIINNAETIHKDSGLQLCLAYYQAFRLSNQKEIITQICQENNEENSDNENNGNEISDNLNLLNVQSNGFIKAFSEKVYEIGDLKKTADLLWIRHILFFPRFEQNVKDSIQSYEVQIIHISLKNSKSNTPKNEETKTNDFKPIVSNELIKLFALLTSLHNAFMSEYGEQLKLTAEESLVFHKKSLEKRTVTDEQKKVLDSILFFRQAFFFLLHEDPIIFNNYLQAVQSRNAGPYHPLWYEFPQAASVFNVAAKYAEENIPSPKLQWIVQLITNLPKDKRILILAEGTGTVNMICRFLAGFTPATTGKGIQIPNIVLDDNQSNNHSNLSSSNNSSKNGKTSSQKDVSENENYDFTLLNDEEPLINPELFGIIDLPMILLQELHAQANVLEKFQPDVVIFWDVTLLSIRRLEVYNSRYKKNVIAYLLSYPEAKEIQKMNNTGTHERDVFLQYIKSLTSLGLLPLNPFVIGQRPIIADDREFRSSFPLGLLRNGFKVVPALITVGDYVLSDEIVIERKAYTDLVGSLKNGRLLQQLQRMKQFYPRPFLLIEFTDVEYNSLSAKGKSSAIMNKLMTILYSFPDVKLIWARNNVEAGKTLNSLAQGTQPPTMSKALAMGSGVKDLRDIAREDSRQIKFLSSIPFLMSSHIEAIVTHCNSLKDLALMKRDKMMSIMEPSIGLKLYSLLHSSVKPV